MATRVYNYVIMRPVLGIASHNNMEIFDSRLCCIFKCILTQLIASLVESSKIEKI